MTDVEQCSLDEHSAVDPNSVLSLLRDFERTEDDPARPLAVVQMEKYLFGAKPGSELRYGTVRNAMEQTDGRLCLRFDDGYGHGYLALVDGELSRLMKPEGFDRYNGPYGISVDLLNKWLRNESVRLTVRENTPFATEDDDPEIVTDGGTDQPGSEQRVPSSEDYCKLCGSEETIPVWEDPADFERGAAPDYVGCLSCNEMRALEAGEEPGGEAGDTCSSCGVGTLRRLEKTTPAVDGGMLREHECPECSVTTWLPDDDGLLTDGGGPQETATEHSDAEFKYVYQGMVGERDTRHEAVADLAKHGDWANNRVVAISENCLVHWDDNGPTHLGDDHYSDRDYLATKHGVVRLERESLVRFVNGNRQDTIESEWFAECPICRREVRVEGGDEAARSDLVSEVLDHCGTEWFPPSDWVEDCDICGSDHREAHGCRSPSLRAPELEHPVEAVDCAECEFEGEPEDLNPPEGVCPDCGTTAVRLHQAVTDGGQPSTGKDHYDAVLRALEPGTLVAVNWSTSHGVETDEMEVEYSSDKETRVRCRAAPEEWMQIYRDRRGELVVREVRDEIGSDHYCDVITLEIVGIASTDGGESA